MKIINFIGAPCAGKSTAAAGTYTQLKLRYLRAELVLEAAKKHSYADTSHLLANQVGIFAEQNEMMFYLDRLAKEGRDSAVDYVVTDSPLLLSAYYAPADYPVSFKAFVLDVYRRYDNLLIYLDRDHPFDQSGRYHGEEESLKVHEDLLMFLEDEHIPYLRMKASESVAIDVLDHLGLAARPNDMMVKRASELMSRIKHLRDHSPLNNEDRDLLENQLRVLDEWQHRTVKKLQNGIQSNDAIVSHRILESAEAIMESVLA